MFQRIRAHFIIDKGIGLRFVNNASRELHYYFLINGDYCMAIK